MTALLSQLKQALQWLTTKLATLRTRPASQDAALPATPPQNTVFTPSPPVSAPVAQTTPPNPDALGAPWSDPHIAHHNVRALCDLMGLTRTELINGTHWLRKDIL